MKWSWIAFAVGANLVLGACAQRDEVLQAQTADELLAVAGAAPPAREVPVGGDLQNLVDDTAIVGRIRAQLARDEELGTYVIDVDSREGLVTLSGVATNERARRRAGAIATATPDVSQVLNQLAVKRA